MSNIILEAGQTYKFTPTGATLKLKTVTDKKVVWYTGLHISNTSKLRTASTSPIRFQQAIDSGTYELV